MPIRTSTASIWVLLMARAGVAFSHAVFWAITASLVMRVAPPGKKTQALGLLAMGSSLAMVLGLPLGRVVGQMLGWRATFALIGMAAVVAMVVLWRVLPLLPSKNAGSLASVPLLCKRPLLVGLYVLTAIAISAHFTAYSYVEPFVTSIGGMSAAMATAVLLVFGAAGIVGSILFNLLHHRYPQAFLRSALAALAVSLLLLLPLAGWPLVWFALAFVWGVSIMGLSLSLQVRVLQMAPDATDVAMAIYSGIYNIGIGGGALIGTMIIAQAGLNHIGLAGAVLAVSGLVLLWGVNRRFGTEGGRMRVRPRKCRKAE